MIMTWMANRWVLWFFCTLFVFGEMFVAKKAYLPVTKKYIKNKKVRTAVNILIGLIFCTALAAVQMWALCDFFHGTFYWKFVVAAAVTATFVYMLIEKIFGNAEDTALGQIFREVLSRSNLFDGKISKAGAVNLASKLHTMVTKIDEEKIKKETEAINEAVSLLDKFVADGNLTEAEKTEAAAVIAKTGGDALKDSPTYKRYQELLNQK